MTNEISLDDAKSYATEANLRKALSKLGLDSYASSSKYGEHVCRYMVVRNKEGRWTAIFLATEHLSLCGGYVAFAAQHGFMSV